MHGTGVTILNIICCAVDTTELKCTCSYEEEAEVYVPSASDHNYKQYMYIIGRTQLRMGLVKVPRRSTCSYEGEASSLCSFGK